MTHTAEAPLYAIRPIYVSAHATERARERLGWRGGARALADLLCADDAIAAKAADLHEKAVSWEADVWIGRIKARFVMVGSKAVTVVPAAWEDGG